MSYQALKLDGNGYASIAHASQAGLDMGLSDFMIEARTKTNYSSAIQFIVDKYYSPSGYQMYIETTNGRLRWMLRESGGDAFRSTDDGDSFCDGRWHYVTIVFDRSSNATRYVDGAAYGTVDSIITKEDEDISSTNRLTLGAAQSGSATFQGLFDEVRIWNFGYAGLPADYADYITWRAAGRNVFKDISEYNGGAWNLYADAERTDKHNGSGTVAGMVVGKKYEYVTATPHTLDYQGGTLDDDGVFTATHTTGTIASGDADDHVWRVGLVARYRFEGDYTDETANNNDLTAGGTGNAFLGYTLKRQKIISPYLIR